MTEAITIQESARLIELEDVIERGLKNFIKVGEALTEIRDKRLWRLEYSNFEEYCREEWEMGRTFVFYTIESAKVVNALDVHNCEPLPKTESQARPLTKLETPEQQREAWTAAVEASDGKPTAKHVEAAVEVVKERAARPLQPFTPTPEEAARIDEAEKDSETLWSLKSYWRKAGKKDRAAFLAWSKTN